MLFLAIETSSREGSLALFRDRDVLKEVFFESGLTCVRDVAARIRDALAAAPLDPTLAGERPRVSAGVVTYPHPAADRPDDLVALVEAGLARAKGQSGERVGIAE